MFFPSHNHARALQYTNTLLPQALTPVRYEAVDLPGVLSNRTVVVSRILYMQKGRVLYYYIDPGSLEFGITDKIIILSNQAVLRYTRLRRLQQQMLISGQVFGFQGQYTNAQAGVTNLYLTTDLCPYRTNYNRDFFTTLQAHKKQTGQDIPLLIFFTGRWIQSNPQAFREICRSGLPFTAGNHTFSHTILKEDSDVPALEKDILKNETYLLTQGILPSPFFRFPGLRYGPRHLQLLRRLNLLPVGVAIWMGQKHIPDEGVILVHTNGTQDIEVKRFIRFLKRNKTALAENKLIFRDIKRLFRRSLPPLLLI